MKVSDAFEPFLDYSQAERLTAASTREKYRDCFRSWLLPWLGDIELENLSRLQVLELRKAMVARSLSTARQYSIVMCLKSFLKFCRAMLSIPCLDPGEIPLPKRPTPRVEYLTNDEVKQVLSAISTSIYSGIRLRVLVELLLATGMRISEALSLTREPFEVEQSEVEIVGKGKRVRRIFFSPRCRFWIKEYLNRRVDDHPALFVTTGYPPRPLKREDISRFFINLKAKARIAKKLTPHVLRHTFCTNLLFHGVDITHIRDLVGHQDIQTTARYYLGRDDRVLQRIVQERLDYGLPADAGEDLSRPKMLHELRSQPPPRQPDASKIQNLPRV